MNQLIADIVLALPAPLRDTGVVSVVWLALCWLAYIFYIRTPLTRRVKERCSEKYLADHMPHWYQHLFYTTVSKKAALDDYGWYSVNRIVFFLLAIISPLHVALLLCREFLPLYLVQADVFLASLVFSVVCFLALMTQPAATMERRRRWGFRRVGNVIHALLWEVLMIAMLFYWMYVAWFVGIL